MSSPGLSKTTLSVLFVVIAVSITALDLWSKKAVFELLNVVSVGDPPAVQHEERYVVIADWFELEANYNYGAFSGMLARHTRWLAALSALALIVIAWIFVYCLRQPAGPGVIFTISLALLWGGTCGNLYDRALLGAVRDWIKWFYVSSSGEPHVWPNFNVADSSICTGVGLLLLLELLRARKPTKTEEAAVRSAAQGA